MNLYPAIDLKDGACVRLLHGDFDALTKYNLIRVIRPVNLPKQDAAGYVVDLDGAVAGTAVNNDAVAAILKAGLPVQLGGGIRSMTQIETWINAGISRVILGTAALKDPQLVIDAAKNFPGKIAVGADARGGMIAAEGWLETTDMPVLDLVKDLKIAVSPLSSLLILVVMVRSPALILKQHLSWPGQRQFLS